MRKIKHGGNTYNNSNSSNKNAIIEYLIKKNIYNDHIRELTKKDDFFQKINLIDIESCYEEIIDDNEILEEIIKNKDADVSDDYLYITKKIHEKFIYPEDNKPKKIEVIAADFTSIYISNVYYGFMKAKEYKDIYGYICSFYAEQMIPTFKYILYYYEQYKDKYKLPKYIFIDSMLSYIKYYEAIEKIKNESDIKYEKKLANSSAIQIFSKYDELKLLENKIDELIKIEQTNPLSFGKKIYKKIFFEIETFNNPIFKEHLDYIKNLYQEFLKLEDLHKININIDLLLSHTKMTDGYERFKLNEFIEDPIMNHDINDEIKLKYYEYNFVKVNFLYNICKETWSEMKEQRKDEDRELQNDYLELINNYINAYKDNINQGFYERISLPFSIFIDHIENYYTIEPYDNYVYNYSTNIEKEFNSVSGGKSNNKYTKTNKKYNNKVVYQMKNNYYIKTKVGDKFKYKKINI